MILLDTNLLVAHTAKTHPYHANVWPRLELLFERHETVVLAPQCVYEAYVVLTRPERVNGLGLRPEVADARLEVALRSFTLIPDPPDLLQLWRQLVVKYNVSGKQAHDARLVAWMFASGVGRFLTLNTDDFKRYTPEIVLMELM